MHIFKRLIWFLQDILKSEWKTEIVTTKRIQEMQNVMEIRSYYVWRIRKLFGKTRLLDVELLAKCTDPDKIKAIIEAVRNVDTSGDYLIAIDNYLCFKDKSGRFLCLEFADDPRRKTILGTSYIDKSGIFYDALQNAGFVGPPSAELQEPIQPPPQQ